MPNFLAFIKGDSYVITWLFYFRFYRGQWEVGRFRPLLQLKPSGKFGVNLVLYEGILALKTLKINILGPIGAIQKPCRISNFWPFFAEKVYFSAISAKIESKCTRFLRGFLFYIFHNALTRD